MNKQEILQKYSTQEDKLLIAQILDKLEFCKTRNKIESTDFLNLYEQNLVNELLEKINFENYYFFGGNVQAERKVLVFFPQKLTKEIAMRNNSKIISVIKIKLPDGIQIDIDHRGYLGAIIKLGLERKKIGDIFVQGKGAEIIVKNEVEEFLIQNLKGLTRFASSEITIKSIDEIEQIESKKIELTEIVSSLRLDNIVATLAKTSRGKALEILEQERVFLNFRSEEKASKQVKVGDIITIRGKGRFEFKEISGNTKKGRYIIKIDKFV